MKMIFILFFITILYAGLANSDTLNWSWSFTPSQLVFGGAGDTDYDGYAYITVKNDSSSTGLIDLSRSGFNPDDGTFGEFGQYRDAAGNLLIVATFLSQPDLILQPGNEVTFSLFFLTPVYKLTEYDGLIEINPLFYAYEYDTSGAAFDSSLSHSSFASEPLLYSYSPVPVPSSFLLLGSGLILLMSRLNKFCYRLKGQEN
jgi:hypothetical protein